MFDSMSYICSMITEKESKKQRRIKWMKVYYILTFSSMHFNICTGFSD